MYAHQKEASILKKWLNNFKFQFVGKCCRAKNSSRYFQNDKKKRQSDMHSDVLRLKIAPYGV